MKHSQFIRSALKEGTYSPFVSYPESKNYPLPKKDSQSFMCNLIKTSSMPEEEKEPFISKIMQELKGKETVYSYLGKKLRTETPSPEAQLEFWAGFIHRLELQGQ